mmetsp:Transcript_6527/g.16215  ORF Transcript_6527/g.16215 Transcript_6527/m.16215 type:complete len:237 (+) Transcript_6527:687-1397(+)
MLPSLVARRAQQLSGADTSRMWRGRLQAPAALQRATSSSSSWTRSSCWRLRSWARSGGRVTPSRRQVPSLSLCLQQAGGRGPTRGCGQARGRRKRRAGQLRARGPACCPWRLRRRVGWVRGCYPVSRAWCGALTCSGRSGTPAATRWTLRWSRACWWPGCTPRWPWWSCCGGRGARAPRSARPCASRLTGASHHGSALSSGRRGGSTDSRCARCRMARPPWAPPPWCTARTSLRTS